MPINKVHANNATSPYPGRLAAAAVTALGAAGIAVNAAQSSAPFARTLVVAFVFLAPAIAITGLLPSINAAVAWIVAAAGSVAINALVAQFMLSANAWSRSLGVIAIGLIAALLWLVPTTRSLAREDDGHPASRPPNDQERC